MSTRARASGAAGTVVDGRFRDLEEQRSLDFPVRQPLIASCTLWGNTATDTCC